MFYIFDGDDAFSREMALNALLAKAADPATAELNTTTLDGRTIDLNELRQHCSTPPFLTDRRLVIVHGLLERLGQKNRQNSKMLSDLQEYLPTMPPSTRLFFVERKKLSSRNPIIALTRDKTLGIRKTFRSLTGRDRMRWVSRQVQQAGGEIEHRAVEALCAYVEGDLYQLNQEIAKLVAYTNRERPITEQDIRLLTPDAHKASIFDLVDALGKRDGRTAATIYHNLLDHGEHPLAILGMITRQYRLMIQVKELAPQVGRADAIARELGQKTYPIRKILAQSANYTPEQLVAVYHKLLATDLEIKTGEMEVTLALDTLIAGLSRTV